MIMRLLKQKLFRGSLQDIHRSWSYEYPTCSVTQFVKDQFASATTTWAKNLVHYSGNNAISGQKLGPAWRKRSNIRRASRSEYSVTGNDFSNDDSFPSSSYLLNCFKTTMKAFLYFTLIRLETSMAKLTKSWCHQLTVYWYSMCHTPFNSKVCFLILIVRTMTAGSFERQLMNRWVDSGFPDASWMFRSILNFILLIVTLYHQMWEILRLNSR